MTFPRCFRRVFDLPVAPDHHHAAGEWQSGSHRGDGGVGRRAGVDASVPGFATYFNKGGCSRALTGGMKNFRAVDFILTRIKRAFLCPLV